MQISRTTTSHNVLVHNILQMWMIILHCVVFVDEDSSMVGIGKLGSTKSK